MTDIAIQVQNLSKRYHIGATRKRHDTLRDALVEGLRTPIESLSAFLHRPSSNGDERRKTNDEYFWALNDVSFEVKRGEVVGIIGANGAGKSTLLKILSRITEPTRGRAIINGRVGSLLEVGTGFHPELTGRENIYLNGAIIGMKRAEIDQKFDEIVAFAEIERFLDTPVKRFSSGMYVRLAFAVAAHLEPEVLLVDEVLAVGDAAFQKKCLGKMGDVAKEGRTVLFVSHNMAAVQQMCESSMLLKDGHLAALGPSRQITSLYLGAGTNGRFKWERASVSDSDAVINSIMLCDHAGRPVQQVTTGTGLAAVVDFTIRRPHHDLQFTVGLLGPAGEDIFDSSPQDAGLEIPERDGDFRAVVYFPSDILLPQCYAIKAGLWALHDGVLDVFSGLRFDVLETASLASVRPGGRAGFLVLPCRWEIHQSSDIR